jgi:hypothetical protein
MDMNRREFVIDSAAGLASAFLISAARTAEFVNRQLPA